MSASRRIVLASGNPGKLREIGDILAPLDIELLPQSRFSVGDVDETGTTFVENAIIKARHAAEKTGLPAIADDSGIEVDCLNGAPGIRSARYAGAGDEANLALLVKNAFATGEAKPSARFQCVMVYMKQADDATPLITQGTWEGLLVETPRGENGFGYDPVFYVPGHGCTSAELPPEVKNTISHRAIALRELSARLKDKL
ncbi:MAG: RdgB/HAM1 family non-canonical purine NTP pyrophosphatase [Gammaproteobacteria bacterium]